MIIKGNTSFLLRTSEFSTLPDELVLKAVVSWAAAYESYRAFRDEHWTALRYEELVADPRATMANLFRFLNLSDPGYAAVASLLPRHAEKNYNFVSLTFNRNHYKREILTRLTPGCSAFGYKSDMSDLRIQPFTYLSTLLKRKLKIR